MSHYADEALKSLGLRAAPKDGPAILIYDIETAPALAWVWSAYETNIIDVERDWYLLSFGYKWLGDSRVDFVGLNDSPGFTPFVEEDRYVAERLAALFDRADVVVAHNGDKFDRRKLNARLLVNRIDPPSPYQTVDTKKVSSREFAHLKNTLNDLGRLLDIGRKMEHQGFSLWLACMAGEAAGWKTMEKYNRQDVLLLEELYLTLLPWMGLPGKPAHPNVGHWKRGETVCPKCGSDDLIKRGFHRSSVSEWQTLQCQNCRGYSRTRVAEKHAEKVGAV